MAFGQATIAAHFTPGRSAAARAAVKDHPHKGTAATVLRVWEAAEVRADENLHVPERIVQLHRVDPLPEEIELIDSIAEPIQSLDRLAADIHTSSAHRRPHALLSQLRKMADNGTVPKPLASKVEGDSRANSHTAKVRGCNTRGKVACRSNLSVGECSFTTRRAKLSCKCAD
jgi:hypothetical protein